ncbi:hypothetical protein G7Y79_00012g033430 [Physcia stellaris]|nr:hypothetical protein G7Y79_00012g033430 [Physcia stellaris]
MLPCLGQILSFRAQIDSLLQHLRDKDGVIRKLTDRIQSDGTDLSKVFPGSASIRSGSRLNAPEAVFKSVKGMARFDELEWRKKLAENNDIPSSPQELIRSVFSSVHSDVQKLSQPIAGQTRSAHLHLNDSQPITLHDELSVHQVESPQASIKREADSSLDDFQRQSTPPSRSPKEEKAIAEGEEAASQNLGKSDKASSISPRWSRGNTAAKAASTSTSPYSPTNAPSVDDREAEDDPDLNCNRPGIANFSKAGTLNTTSNSKHKLARIGSRKKDAIQSTNEEDLSLKTSVSGIMPKSEDAAVKKPRHKLGKIGDRARTIEEGGAKAKDSTTHDKPSPANQRKYPGGDQNINNTQDIPQTEPKMPGTAVPSSEANQRSPGKISTMQANENRERLKRDLETKSSSINKKKRKF